MKLIISLLVVLLLAPSCLPAQAPPSLRVLIVSAGDDSCADGFKDLLVHHGVVAAVHPWKEATVEKSRKFDLVMIVGKGRRISRAGIVVDYRRPVLGVGPYGCKYFGRLKLKNGHPYT